MVSKLTKNQWLQVVQVKAIGLWENDPEVVSHKIIRPTVADPYYFWIHWNTPEGKAGKDRVGWEVKDLNKHLLKGNLMFKTAGMSQWTNKLMMI